MNYTKQQSGGFTIVELMIATTIFSVLLLIGVAAFVQIGRYYSKGVTTARTQEAARGIMEDITRAIQFSATAVDFVPGTKTTDGTVCLKGQRYTFRIGRQISDNPDTALEQIRHALVVDPVDACPTTKTAPNLENAALPADAREILPAGMRLSQLRVDRVGTSSLYNVTVKVAAGENDLLDNFDNENAKCKDSTVGTQFCAVSNLTTTVMRRLP